MSRSWSGSSRVADRRAVTAARPLVGIVPVRTAHLSLSVGAMKSAAGTLIEATGFRAPLPRVPEVRSPFPSRVNRYTAEAEHRALQWAQRIGLIGPAEVAALARQRFGQLAGRCHPDFGLVRLSDICRWYL